MRDDIDAKPLPLDLVDGQRNAVERDGTLGRDRARETCRRGKQEAQRIALRPTIEDARDAVDMAEHDMAAELVAEAQRALEVDLGPHAPAREGGARHGLGRDHGSEPVRPLLDHRQTGTRTGDRSADRGVGEVETGSDHQPGIAASLNGANLSKIADDAAEHAARLRCAAIGFQDILAGFDEPAALEAWRLGEVFEAEGDDRRDAVAADQPRRAEPSQAIDQPIAQQ